MRAFSCRHLVGWVPDGNSGRVMHPAWISGSHPIWPQTPLWRIYQPRASWPEPPASQPPWRFPAQTSFLRILWSAIFISLQTFLGITGSTSGRSAEMFDAQAINPSREGRASRTRMAAAKAAGCGSHRSPVTPGTTLSRGPPLLQVITGLPVDMSDSLVWHSALTRHRGASQLQHILHKPVPKPC